MILIVIYHKIHGHPCRQIDLQQTHSLPRHLHAWWCLIGNSNKGNHKIQTKDAIGLLPLYILFIMCIDIHDSVY